MSGNADGIPGTSMETIQNVLLKILYDLLQSTKVGAPPQLDRAFSSSSIPSLSK